MADFTAETFPDICKKFVDTDFLESIQEVIKKHGPTIGTVHFSLIAMLVNDIVQEAQTVDRAAASILSLQAFAYQCMSQMWHNKMQGVSRPMEVN